MQPPEHETGLAELISLPRGLEGANPWLGSSWCNLHAAECLERAPKGLSFLELLEGSGVAASSCCSSHELGEVQGGFPSQPGTGPGFTGGLRGAGGAGGSCPCVLLHVSPHQFGPLGAGAFTSAPSSHAAASEAV